MFRLGLGLAACVAAGCGSATTGVVVDLSLAPAAPSPSSLRLDVYQDATLVGSGAVMPRLPGRVVVDFPDGQARSVCIIVAGGAVSGSASVDIVAHRQAHARIELGLAPSAGCQGGAPDLGASDLGASDSAAAPDQALPSQSITFVGASSGSMLASGFLDLARPANAVTGDYLLVSLSHDDVDPMMTAPAGWTSEQSRVDNNGNFTAFWLSHRVGASEPTSYRFTWSAGLYDCAGTLAAYRGVGSIDNQALLTDPGQPYDAPSLDASQAGELLVTAFVADGDFRTESLDWRASPELVERADTGESAILDQWQTVGGATGTRAATLFSNGAQVTNRDAMSWSVLLQP